MGAEHQMSIWHGALSWASPAWQHLCAAVHYVVSIWIIPEWHLIREGRQTSKDSDDRYSNKFQSYFLEMLLSGSTHSSAVYQCFPCWTFLIWESFALVIMEVSVCICVRSWVKGTGVPNIAILRIGSSSFRCRGVLSRPIIVAAM